MVNAEELRAGKTYTGGTVLSRRIYSIDDGIVTYAVAGVFTLRPLCQSVAQFAAWAERECKPVL